jgi:acetyl-CoA carboxylase alpha subunit
VRVLDAIEAALSHLSAIPSEQLRETRYRKYRRIGSWRDETTPPITIGTFA